MARTAFPVGLEIDGDGSHPAAWRRVSHSPADLLDPGRLLRLGEVAESSGLAFVTLDDDIVPPGSAPDVVGRIGSVERAAYLAPSLTTLSVVPVVSTTYSEPFHLSSQLASIDHLAAGRTGWIVSTSPTSGAAKAWGRAPVLDAEGLAREATDATRVVRDLWDSWEDDAVIRDVASSRYLDRDRLHYIDFVGDTYSVKGPAIVPRPPQGHVVVLAPAGLVPDDLIDVALITAPALSGIDDQAASSRAPRVFAEVEVALDTEAASADARLSDLEQYGPWPDAGRLRYVGSPGGLVNLLRQLAKAVDGVRLHPLVLSEDLRVLSRLVVPRLLAEGISTRPRSGATFRSALGLPRPASRYETPVSATRGAVG
jgi:alkanesulfonate monooxygenase SsuD/methylene tetrahydromethanopterin reductase-like flavin-dependent oxidoreductase (luciferase family)